MQDRKIKKSKKQNHRNSKKDNGEMVLCPSRCFKMIN